MPGTPNVSDYGSIKSDDEIKIIFGSEDLTNDQRIVKMIGLLENLNENVQNVRTLIVNKNIEVIEHATQTTRGWVVSATLLTILAVAAGLFIYGIVGLVQNKDTLFEHRGPKTH